MVKLNTDTGDVKIPDFFIKKGATQPSVDAILVDDSDDTAINLTNKTVRFRMKEQTTDTLLVDDDVVVNDAEAGDVTYVWKDGDTDTAGYFYAEFAIDHDGNTGSNFDADEFIPGDDYITVKIEEPL